MHNFLNPINNILYKESIYYTSSISFEYTSKIINNNFSVFQTKFKLNDYYGAHNTLVSKFRWIYLSNKT